MRIVAAFPLEMLEFGQVRHLLPPPHNVNRSPGPLESRADYRALLPEHLTHALGRNMQRTIRDVRMGPNGKPSDRHLLGKKRRGVWVWDPNARDGFSTLPQGFKWRTRRLLNAREKTRVGRLRFQHRSKGLVSDGGIESRALGRFVLRSAEGSNGFNVFENFKVRIWVGQQG